MYFWLHSIPERISHGQSKIQFQLVAVMSLLALFTSYRRQGPVDFTTFEEALRLARAVGDPVLVLSVLNNFAWIAIEAEPPRGIALAAEMQGVIDRELGGVAASAPLDTIAHALLA